MKAAYLAPNFEFRYWVHAIQLWARMLHDSDTDLNEYLTEECGTWNHEPEYYWTEIVVVRPIMGSTPDRCTVQIRRRTCLLVSTLRRYPDRGPQIFIEFPKYFGHLLVPTATAPGKR